MPEKKITYSLCDACRRPIRLGESQRLILDYQLHLDDECFDMYVMKVGKGELKIPFSLKKVPK
jgi:hypothetical protein